MKYVMLFEEWNENISKKRYDLIQNFPEEGLIEFESEEQMFNILSYLALEKKKINHYLLGKFDMESEVGVSQYCNEWFDTHRKANKKWVIFNEHEWRMETISHTYKGKNVYKFDDLFTPKPEFKGYHASKRLGL